jgi:hypothetical protein
VSKELIFDDDVRFFSSQDSPSVIEENVEVIFPDTDSKTRDESNLQGVEVRLSCGYALTYSSLQEVEMAYPDITGGSRKHKSAQIFSEGECTS